MNHEINRLLNYGLQNGMIYEDDIDYSANLLVDLLKLDTFEKEDIDEKLETANDIIENILSYAVKKGLVEDSVVFKDLFDTKLMNCIMPRPSEVINQFNNLKEVSSKDATDYFYDLSVASNYIRKNRTDKNIRFKKFYKYGDIEITINLSKPEKDPKAIALAKNQKSSNYPKCLLCKENVGFAGNVNHPARQNHRIIPLKLNGDNYYFQYSPYVYYNEHCIIFNKEHKPMVVNKETFEHLLSFVEQFPHYLLGSNADLPIVGGSILSHDHYQGGNYEFPMDGAKVFKTITHRDIQIDFLQWPLSTVRLISKNKEHIIHLSEHILNKWINYSNEDIDIIKGSVKTLEQKSPWSLKEALGYIKKEYDVCLIDTRPVFDVLTKNALYAADVLLTPVKFDNFCRDNLTMVEDAYHELKEKNPELEWKVFANMVANVKAQKVSSADLLGKHDYPFMQSCISRTAIVDNALSLYKPVAKHRGGSNVAQDFVDLVDELLED